MVEKTTENYSTKPLAHYLLGRFLILTLGFIAAFLTIYFVLSKEINRKSLEDIVDHTLETIRPNATIAAFSSSEAMAAFALSPLESVPWVRRASLLDSFGDTLQVLENRKPTSPDRGPPAGAEDAGPLRDENGTTVSYALTYRGQDAGRLVVEVDYSRGRSVLVDLLIGMISIIACTTMVSLANYLFIKRRIVVPIERLARFVQDPASRSVRGMAVGRRTEAEGRTSPSAMFEIAELDAISVELEKTVSHLSEQATIDPLTGLANRRAFDAALKETVSSGGSVALMLLDIDYFKFINDHFGHVAGDRTLQDFAAYLRDFAGETGQAYRLGGDEFGVLLFGGETASEEIIGRVKTAFSFDFEQLDNTSIYYSVSAGYAHFPTDVADGAELGFGASAALLSAKVQGRKTVNRHGGEEAAPGLSSRLPVREYECALADGRVTHFAQPIVCPQSGRIRAFELLLRVLPREGGASVRADLAVEAAIRIGLAGDLTRRTLQAARDVIGQLRAHDRGGICVSINLAEAQLTAPDFVEIFDEVFDGADKASGLIVEMLEGDYLGSRSLADIIADLRHRRSAIAIDDFGKGYSSLLRLFAMPSNIVKLDRSLLHYREKDPRLLGGMIAALSSGGRLVVVEGVETEEDARFVRDAGAGLAQGYFYARPMPFDEAICAACAVPVAMEDQPICDTRAGGRQRA